MQSVFTGPVYVVRDNIDTDQIIPAQYLNLIPTIPEEYEKLGSYALCGLPESLYPTRFVKEGKLDSELSYRRGRKKFRLRQFARACAHRAGFGRMQGGSSRKFRAHLLPQQRRHRRTLSVRNHRTPLRHAENRRRRHGGSRCRNCHAQEHWQGLSNSNRSATCVPVVDAGGLFNYARQTGMIAK